MWRSAVQKFSSGGSGFDPKKDLACVGDKSNCSVICTLFKITKKTIQILFIFNLAAPSPSPAEYKFQAALLSLKTY